MGGGTLDGGKPSPPPGEHGGGGNRTRARFQPNRQPHKADRVVRVATQKRRPTPWLPAPGANSALAYLWLIFLGPILLLAAGIVLTVVGLSQESAGVATIGAIGIVASLILPRMKGLFKLGPGGIEGEFRDELLDEIMRQAMARGLPQSEAQQVAQTARDELSPEPPFITPPAGEDLTRRVWSTYAATFVDHALDHQRAVLEVARRVAEQRGWRIAEEPPELGLYGRVDMAMETNDGLVLIEANNLTSWGGNGFIMLRWALAAAKQALGARAAFIVLPDRAVLESGELEGVEIAKLSELEDALLAR